MAKPKPPSAKAKPAKSTKAAPAKASPARQAAPPVAEAKPAPAAKPAKPQISGRPDQPSWVQLNKGHSQKMAKGRPFRHQGR